MRVIIALFLLWFNSAKCLDIAPNLGFPKVSKGLGNSFFQESQKPTGRLFNFNFGNFTFIRKRREAANKLYNKRNAYSRDELGFYRKALAPGSGDLLGGKAAGGNKGKLLVLDGFKGNGSVTQQGDGGLLGQVMAEDEAGNMAAGMAELQLPGKGVTGPIYEVVGAGIKLPPPPTGAPPPPPPPARMKTRPAAKNSSAVGEVTVNIQHSNQPKHPKVKLRHWCDLSGVWINDEGSLLLTLGFPSRDKTLLTGYLSQVSVDMTPTEADSRRRRRRSGDEPPPHFPPPPAGTSGIPSSLTNRTVLQGSSVTRAGPFALVTRHGGAAVGSMVGQCQVCGGLDTIVAQFSAVSEVFACLDALWSHKTVHLMFRKWGERHRRRHHHHPQLLETEVVIKQRDRSHTPRPPPPPPHETVEVHEEVEEEISIR